MDIDNQLRGQLLHCRAAETLVLDLYGGCGVGLSHIELLTGQPAATAGYHCVAWGIALRRPGGRCPFLRRLGLAGSPTDVEDA